VVEGRRVALSEHFASKLIPNLLGLLFGTKSTLLGQRKRERKGIVAKQIKENQRESKKEIIHSRSQNDPSPTNHLLECGCN
jgi:hypothetical protein